MNGYIYLFWTKFDQKLDEKEGKKIVSTGFTFKFHVCQLILFNQLWGNGNEFCTQIVYKILSIKDLFKKILIIMSINGKS